ncbi:Cell wall-binding protein YocH precursor [compost metagenome]
MHDGKRVIAVDPAVIPLGSDVEIRFSSGEVIEAIAVDTGGGINGNEIDILKQTEANALDFGRQEVGVRIKSKGD